MQKAFAAIAQHFDKAEDDDAPMLSILCSKCVSRWLPPSHIAAAEASLWVAICKLRASLKTFRAIGNSPAERVQADVAEEGMWPLMTDLRMMRDAASKRSSNLGQRSGGVKALGDQLIANAETEIASFADAAIHMKLAEAKITSDSLAEIAGGADGGGSWTDGLAKRPTPDQLNNHFKRNLATRDMAPLKQQCDALHEAG